MLFAKRRLFKRPCREHGRTFIAADGRLLHRPVVDVPVTIRITATDRAGDAVPLGTLVVSNGAEGPTWHELDVDLAPVAGRDVSFAFEAEPLGSAGGAGQVAQKALLSTLDGPRRRA